MERGSIILHELCDNKVSLEINLVNGDVWLDMLEIAQLLGVFYQAVRAGIQMQYKRELLFEHETRRNIEGRDCYNLDMIFALANYCKDGYCYAIRRWIVSRLKVTKPVAPTPPIIVTISDSALIS